MPDIPDAAVRAALTAYAHALYDRPSPTVLSDRALVQLVLEAAAPAMAEHAAKAVLTHMEAHGPQPGTPLGGAMRRAWRSHFRIASQVVSLAFSTEEDIRRIAAEALSRGDFVACPALEDGNPVGGERED